MKNPDFLFRNPDLLLNNKIGWQLGEHDTWAKMTNFEVALRTPLIIRAPWMKASTGKVTSVLAEAVDFYPTLAALVGLPTPESTGQQINGTSLVPAFADPEGSAMMKDAAYSQFAKVSTAHKQSPPQRDTRGVSEGVLAVAAEPSGSIRVLADAAAERHGDHGIHRPRGRVAIHLLVWLRRPDPDPQS